MNEVTTGTVGTEGVGMECATHLGLVFRVSVCETHFVLSVRELTLVAVSAVATLLE